MKWSGGGFDGGGVEPWVEGVDKDGGEGFPSSCRTKGGYGGVWVG